MKMSEPTDIGQASEVLASAGLQATLGGGLIALYRLGRLAIYGFTIPNCSISCENPAQL